MTAHVVNVQDRPDLEEKIARPGGARGAGRKSTRFLGLPGEDFVHPTKPPYAYFIERPKGDVTPTTPTTRTASSSSSRAGSSGASAASRPSSTVQGR